MATTQQPTGEIVLYQTDDGRTRVEYRFADAELDPVATIRTFRIVRREGSRGRSDDQRLRNPFFEGSGVR